MGLPTRNLDDRTFQNIVDEAKKRIAASCPGWTDHNVSDPGITLVELFAWMTEMILYRLNQVPEKNYIKFLELLGLKLQEPEPARAAVTFYLSAPQPNSVIIPKGTEVATVRTETRSSVIFSTEADLEIQPPQLTALLTRAMTSQDKAKYTAHNLKQLNVSSFSFDAFGSKAIPGDALYFGFENDLSDHVLGLELTCLTAKGMGIDINNPPWLWEVWYGDSGERRWLPAVVEEDDTGGMNQSGLIRLRLPRMRQREFRQRRAYWVRCRVIEPAEAGKNYETSPRLSNVVATSWGGSMWANHASVVRNETLGRSDGAPGQSFQVEYTPLLRREAGETIEIRAEGQEQWESWTEVADFADASPFDKHFTCDSATGEIRFGPALRQPDGSVKSFGAIPPRKATIRFAAYRHGGGVIGNVQAHTLTVPKTSIPYVDRVTNHAEASGGRDQETVEMVQMRAQQLLRSRGRAVTPSDYEALAVLADSRVQRARCVQPEAASAGRDPLAAQIYLLIIPRLNQPERRMEREQLRLDEDLREAVHRYLDDYRLLTVRLDIREPEYSWVSATVEVTTRVAADPERVRQDVERRLYRFLNPLIGGPDGRGWPFGRPLYPSDIYACLQSVSGIEYIESLQLYQVSSSGSRTEISGKLDVPGHGLVASAAHLVNVKQGVFV